MPGDAQEEGEVVGGEGRDQEEDGREGRRGGRGEAGRGEDGREGGGGGRGEAGRPLIYFINKNKNVQNAS